MEAVWNCHIFINCTHRLSFGESYVFVLDLHACIWSFQMNTLARVFNTFDLFVILQVSCKQNAKLLCTRFVPVSPLFPCELFFQPDFWLGVGCFVYSTFHLW